MACGAGVDKSLRISVNMVTKTLLQYLMLLAPDPDFPELWARILQVLQVLYCSLCFSSRSLQHVLLLWACIMLSSRQTVFCAYAFCVCYLDVATKTMLF